MYRERARNAAHLASRRTRHTTRILHRACAPRESPTTAPRRSSSGWARQHRPRLCGGDPGRGEAAVGIARPLAYPAPCSLRGSGKRLELPPGHCHIPHALFPPSSTPPTFASSCFLSPACRYCLQEVLLPLLFRRVLFRNREEPPPSAISTSPPQPTRRRQSNLSACISFTGPTLVSITTPFPGVPQPAAQPESRPPPSIARVI
ncbi:hypothetical protein K505DRAFT_45484 [Melanomma pulvis-pyrius CBS 109.77]|uniref:Uncharacterized protein n=1 Tax=Melanomma pulvis-pyrius CBS 109.77 TaxID=1314802 RepID=A0A6A6XBS0_9PLEO|nr:hypothetical protein K505DRAFT_45484 [Melanomma pulvis-pyrius CBS 109.77]